MQATSHQAKLSTVIDVHNGIEGLRRLVVEVKSLADSQFPMTAAGSKMPSLKSNESSKAYSVLIQGSIICSEALR